MNSKQIILIFSESLMAIVDVFRISLENRGKTDVPFHVCGVLQRRKSRVQTLDAPKEMTRNLSETHLLQLGSKAISNVAGQFSKLSQTFSPKIRTGRKLDGEGSGNSSERGSDSNVDENDSEAGDEVKEERSSASVEHAAIVKNACFAENAHLEGVGIVMATDSADVESMKAVEGRKSSKLSDNVSLLSISSVTESVSMPNAMLGSLEAPGRASSPAPEILVQEIDDASNLTKIGSSKLCRSTHEVSR